MTIKPYMSFSIRKSAISLLLLLAATGVQAQAKFFSIQKDSIPLFRGFAVSFDVVGAAMKMLSDYGQYEGALRVNLHDEWFPIVEAGFGKATHDDEVTRVYYSTSAPYFKIGIDKNMLKDKHGPNRLYVGLRYGFTSYKVDIARPDFVDPYWKWDAGYGIKDAACKYHWAEIVVGVDAKIFGPLHLGWSVRYKQRLAHSEDAPLDKTWYVPGFGTYDTKLGGTFNVIIDI